MKSDKIISNYSSNDKEGGDKSQKNEESKVSEGPSADDQNLASGTKEEDDQT